MNPADLALQSISPTLTTKTLPTPLSVVQQKNGSLSVPRVDLEPIYTQLKAALGEQWTEYKAAVNAFLLGNLNQAELAWVLQPVLSPAPSVITSADATRSPVSTLHLHNTLLASIFANTLRDPPPTDVAPWVVATDKPTSTAKNAGTTGANDKAEERLKRETMALHARDRRRIKTVKDTGNAVNDGFAEIQHYKHELAVKPPDITPPTAGGANAGGLPKTNWDLEIRRRYAQPLAAETLEFPTHSNIQNRIEPICYEEGLMAAAQGAQNSIQACAELVEQATEVFVKEMLSQLCAHARSNAQGCVQTAGFRRQLRKEEGDTERGALQRTAAGLLPVEAEVQSGREPMDMNDLRLALRLQDSFLRRDRFLSETVALGVWPDLDVGRKELGVNGTLTKAEKVAAAMRDRAAGEEVEGWKGGTGADRDELIGVLGECLAVG